ncbi:MAG: zinc-ribbon domain-containing protein, partial [Candidatus Acidiferrales bacterium]
MAHCTKCGAQVDDGAAYCQVCGERQPVVAAQPVGTSAGGGSTPPGAAGTSPGGAQRDAASGSSATPGVKSGLSENVAATLSYALGWVTGLIFL